MLNVLVLSGLSSRIDDFWYSCFHRLPAVVSSLNDQAVGGQARGICECSNLPYSVPVLDLLLCAVKQQQILSNFT
jgi:hypothetical protein